MACEIGIERWGGYVNYRIGERVLSPKFSLAMNTILPTGPDHCKICRFGEKTCSVFDSLRYDPARQERMLKRHCALTQVSIFAHVPLNNRCTRKYRIKTNNTMPAKIGPFHLPTFPKALKNTTKRTLSMVTGWHGLSACAEERDFSRAFRQWRAVGQWC